jgi:hypothetical protein
MGWLLIGIGVLLTIWIGRMGHYGGANVAPIFYGRPGLLTIAGALGPICVVVGIVLLVSD